MKLASGMIRSSEMAKKAPKVIEHIQVHPHLGGGVRVEHHHTEPMVHPPAVHHFGPEEGSAFHDHMEKHTGMSWGGDDAEAKKEEAEEEAREEA